MEDTIYSCVSKYPVSYNLWISVIKPIIYFYTKFLLYYTHQQTIIVASSLCSCSQRIVKGYAYERGSQNCHSVAAIIIRRSADNSMGMFQMVGIIIFSISITNITGTIYWPGGIHRL